MKKTVSTSGASLRFRWAIWSSVSKSLTARRPRTMKPAPTVRANSTVRPSKVVTSTRSPAAPQLVPDRLADDVGTARRGDRRGLAGVRRGPPTTSRSKTAHGAADDVEMAERDGVEATPGRRPGSSCRSPPARSRDDTRSARSRRSAVRGPAGASRRRSRRPIAPEVLGDDAGVVVEPAEASDRRPRSGSRRAGRTARTAGRGGRRRRVPRTPARVSAPARRTAIASRWTTRARPSTPAWREVGAGDARPPCRRTP